MHKRAGWLVLVVMLIAACGEPAVDVDIPDRGEGQRLFDEPGVVDEAAVADALDQASADSGLDVVGMVFEDDHINAGQADRGGRELLDAWDADVVLVAVAAPGDFDSADDERERFFGVYASDRFEIPRSLREEIIDEYMTPYAQDNAWTEGFVTSADALRDGVEESGDS